MRRILPLVFGLILALAAVSPPVFSQGPPEKKGWQFRGGRGMGPMHSPMMDWASRLNLTDEQSARIQELREAYLRDTLPSRNELLVKRFDLRDLLRDPQADANAILAKQREVSELESKIQERARSFSNRGAQGPYPGADSAPPAGRRRDARPAHDAGPGAGKGVAWQFSSLAI